jgi:polynucleotide 5'-hydroxyl-kinase GRC3/NOL9
MNEDNIPCEWKNIKPNQLNGILMIIGATDVGKSTFAKYLYSCLLRQHQILAYLDGDPGQSTLGPPAHMTVKMSLETDRDFPPGGETRRMFVGSTTPVRHMLPMVTSAARLAMFAVNSGAKAVVYDTTGLIDPGQGGLNLKMAKIDSLQPGVVFGLQREKELEQLLIPLRKSKRLIVMDLPHCKSASIRDMETRQVNRENSFRNFFREAKPLMIDWPSYAVFPEPVFQQHRLLSLENKKGYAIGSAIVLKNFRDSKRVQILSTLQTLKELDTIRLGDVIVDPDTFKHELIR